MIALEANLGTIWDPFWTPKSLQNRPQIGSEPSQNPMLAFDRHPGPAKIDLSTNMTPTWLQNGPHMGSPKLLFWRFLGRETIRILSDLDENKLGGRVARAEFDFEDPGG